MIAKIIHLKIIVCDPKRGAQLGKHRVSIQNEKDASKTV